MNRLGVRLLMPWVASARHARLLAALFTGGALLVACAMAVTGEAHAHRGIFILVLGFAVWSLWGSYLGSNLMLVRSARELCLPRMQHDADLSLLLFAVPSLALPVALCWMLGAPPLLAAAVFTAAAALGLAYMLLPLWVGLPLLMATVFTIMTHGLNEPLSTCWGAAVVLVVVDVLRWWQLRTASEVPRHGLRAAALFYCYRRDAMANGGWFGFAQRFLPERVTVPRHAELRGVGPHHIVGSIRFALGGLGMPKPFASRLQDIGRLLAFIWVFVLFGLLAPLLASPAQAGGARGILLHWGSPLLTFGSLMTCCVAVNVFAGRARALWRNPDAELPLLALLPGLGGGAAGKRSAVTAVLAPPTVFLACTCAVLCIGTLALHTTAWAYAALALCCAGALVLIVAVTLASLAGRPMHTIEYVSWYIVQLVLSMLVLMKAMPSDRYHGPHPDQFGVMPAWLLLAWSVYLFVLILLAINNAREMRRRPHAFLAHAP
jgi:hypothetical protein